MSWNKWRYFWQIELKQAGFGLWLLLLLYIRRLPTPSWACTSVFCHEHILLNLVHHPYIFEQSMEDRARTFFTISVVFLVVVRPVVWQGVVSTSATSTNNRGFTVDADKDHYDLELPLKQIFESNSVYSLLLVIGKFAGEPNFENKFCLFTSWQSRSVRLKIR